MIAARMAGESNGSSAPEGDLPKVSSPAKDHGLAVGADTRESRKVDVPFRPMGAGCPGMQGPHGSRGEPRNQEVDHPRRQNEAEDGAKQEPTIHDVSPNLPTSQS